jgi:hypothetical protein
MKEMTIAEAITPDSRVGAILNEFPQLEEVLLKMSPAFAHLRNPVLRKTVAKVATLRQVAKIGDVPLATLINTLRSAVGVAEEWTDESLARGDSDAPAWLATATVAKTLDARPIIAGGGHPLEQVLREVSEMPDGEVFMFVTPFQPAPLLELLKKQGHKVWSRKTEEAMFENYVRKLD